MALKKVLLVHGLESIEMAKLQLSGHKLIKIDNENGGTVLKDLLEGKSIASKEPLPDERVVIHHGYSESELKQNLANFKTLLNKKPIVAIVTEHSINWPYEYLLIEHLMKDRDENVKLEIERREKAEKEKAENK